MPQTSPSPDTATEPAGAVPAGGLRLNVELLCWAAVVTAAALWRLPQLGALLPDPREAVAAAAAWQMAHGTTPPGWGGDLTSSLAAIALRLDGDAIGWARFPAALAGVLTTAALALLRPYSGKAVALLAALLFAASPIATGAARTLSPDSVALLCGVIILWAMLRLAESGDSRAVPVLGAAAGIASGTGALVLIPAVATLMWLAIETRWLERAGLATNLRLTLGHRRGAQRALLAAGPGLLLALFRYGAGLRRLSLPAFSDLAPATSLPLPWHAPLTMPAWYEPLTLSLGLASAAYLVWQAWRRGPASLALLERLVLVWATVALLLGLVAVHSRPSMAIAVALPLHLLAAMVTVRKLPALAGIPWREGGLLLAAVPVIFGYVALQALSWSRTGSVPGDELLACLVLLVVATTLAGFALPPDRRVIEGALVLSLWLVLGWMAPHGASAVAFRTGDEPARGARVYPERQALLPAIIRFSNSGAAFVERTPATALAWELRGRSVRTAPGLPPAGVTALLPAESELPAGAVVVTGPVPMAASWYPSGWNGPGIIRWLVRREAWGGPAISRGQIVIIP